MSSRPGTVFFVACYETQELTIWVPSVVMPIQFVFSNYRLYESRACSISSSPKNRRYIFFIFLFLFFFFLEKISRGTQIDRREAEALDAAAPRVFEGVGGSGGGGDNTCSFPCLCTSRLQLKAVIVREGSVWCKEREGTW
jgi:hypothetical protein